MRGPNSPRPLRATSSTSLFAIVLSSVVLSIVFLANPANTRSVGSQHEIGLTDHEVIDGKLSPDSHVNLEESSAVKKHDFVDSQHGISKRDKIEKDIPKDEKSTLTTNIGASIEEEDAIGKSSVISEFVDTKIVENSAKDDQEEGIRRFDAIVINEDDKGAGKGEKKRVEQPEIGKTVIKGIIVRDADEVSPIDEQPQVPQVADLSGVKVHRKRSLADPKLTAESIDAVAVEPSVANENIEPANDAREKIVDYAETRQVPVLIPVGSSHAKLEQAEKVDALKTSAIQEEEKPADLLPAGESNVEAQAKAATEEIARAIPELTPAHEKSTKQIPTSDKPVAKEEIVLPQIKKIIIHENGLGEVVDKLEIGKDEVLSARASLPIAEGTKNEEEKEQPARNEDETVTKNEEHLRSETADESYLLSLSSVIKTNESLEGLKAQAVSFQRQIKDKSYLQRLQEQAIEILPGIPKFTEIQLLDSLKAISSSKKLDHSSESYLSKLDTSSLSDSQLQILKCSEALLVREQRQSFAENMMDCVRSLNILNCMRIFVWPIIADNIPQSLSQNLPTLPIEIHVSDWLPGSQRSTSGHTRSRSAASSPRHRLITPEVVVSTILNDALNANPSKIADALPTFIDPQNETLSKWLTPGQLEILKMAEKFLPESNRLEYSNRMSSCVRRFEYFSCVKYFAWPMVKQHYADLPDFPDYQSWYPSATLYPGYPILPYPNADGIGELPEVVEADATRTRSPRPEAVIVQILENALRQASGYRIYQTYQARQPAPILAPISPEQMAIFYTAEQLIPVQLRADFMTKSMKCIQDYDVLTCTKYSTWPTVRQWFPSLPELPDFSSWVPTFAGPQLPDFSQYIPDFSSYIPSFPGSSGSTTPKPETASQPQPIPDKPPQEGNVTVLLKDDQLATNSMENRIIQILSNIEWVSLLRNGQPLTSVTPESLTVLKSLTYNQLRILGLAKNAVPAPVRGDLDSRLVGCLQGGSDFLSCTRNVIWPTLQLYVRNMPNFPKEEEAEPTMQKVSEAIYSLPAIKPGVYQPFIVDPASGAQPVYSENAGESIGRSPTSGQILAEPEESAIPASPLQPGNQVLQDAASSSVPTAPLRQGPSAKSNDPTIPVISVTDPRFTPIFSDHPETVLLKILTTIQASSKYADPSYSLEKPGYLESLNDYLNANQKNVIRISENLLPEEVKANFMEKVRGCVAKSNFVVCSRDIIWPSLSQYYQRLPSFPNFYINDPIEKIDLSGTVKSFQPGPAAISETDVKTGQQGDAMVTITDTRFVPIYSQHPEAVILSILKNVQATSPNLLAQSGGPKVVTRTPEFLATFSDQQGNIVTVAENLLPESIREVFTKRISECVKENSFLACTRDIAWPTIAQFFPRLPNFPNIEALPDYANGKPQSAFLPPQLEPAKSSLAPEDQGLSAPNENLVSVTPDDVESRIEATLKQVASSSHNSIQPKFSFLNTEDPVVASFVTEKQANVIRLSEEMLPNAVKPVFVGKMIDCARGDVFPNCVRNIGWPTLRQYVPSIPEFPDFGTYVPQVPQIPQIPQIPEIPQIPDYQIPQIPQVPDYQIPQLPDYQSQIPSFPGFQYPGQGFGYGFRAAQEKIGHEPSLLLATQQQSQSGGVFASGVQGLTSSVESTSAADPDSPGSSGLSPAMVPGFPGQPTDLLRDVPSEGRRKRRNIGEEPSVNYQDISSDKLSPQLPPNMTESEFLKILVNITNQTKKVATVSGESLMKDLNLTTKNNLTKEQVAILKMVEDISIQTSKGFMSQLYQCITGLSFIRCIGIFVWPVITQNVPSLLGNLNPFGRSSSNTETFEDIFGMTSKDFEKELLERKANVEEILVDWYRGVIEKKYDNDYGFLRVQGYGDGEIGISFNGLKRKGRGAKFKDSKNMPSILTIISDIMEDMLDQRGDSRPDKKDHGKRDRSLREGDEDDANRVFNEHDRRKDSERSSNDDQIITMFLEKIKANGTVDNGGAEGVDGDHYLSIEDAYEAFELLFGTRLSERMAEKLHDLDKSHYRVVNEGKSFGLPRKLHKIFGKTLEERKGSEDNGGTIRIERKKKIRSGLILRLPKIEEEFVSRKMTSSLVELGRKMKVKMSQIVPGVSFLISFFVQMALAHARAAASVAGMMSNMALGSAMMSMIRQSFFGSMGHPKVKHVYDNPAMGPGIIWPKYDYHG